MYNKKKQKAKFKLRAELLVLVASIVIMITLSIVLRLPDAQTKISNSYSEAGISLSSTHVYEEIDFDELYEKIEEKELMYVYFASPNCNETSSSITKINERALYYNVETVYIVDATDYLIDEEAEDYEEDVKLTAEIKEIETNLAKYFTSGSKDAIDTEIAGISLEHTGALWAFNDSKLVYNSCSYFDDEDTIGDYNWSLLADLAFFIKLDEKK